MENNPFPPCRRSTLRPVLAVICGLAAGLLAGCENGDEIVRRPVPQPEKVQQEARPEEKPKVRLLATMVPHGDRFWFFKLLGPVDEVGRQEKALDTFIRSVRVADDPKQPIRWQLPEGWREEPGRGMRYATIRLGPEEAALEMSVSTASGSVINNINRWRNIDLGLKPILEAQVGEVVKKVEVNGVEVILVDMSGPGTGKTGMGLRLGAAK